MKKKLLILLIFIVVFILYIIKYINTKFSNENIFYIEKNKSLNYVIEKLESEKLVKKPKLFKIIMRIVFFKKHIKYGEFKIDKNDTYLKLIKKFIKHDVYYRSITIPEGFTNNSVFKLIESNKFLSGNIDNKNKIKEGTLMPDTYKFLRDDSRNSIISRMQKSMEDFLDYIWKSYNSNNYIKTKDDLIILASIVEKETGLVEERKVIASVFLNRLKINMRLQSDPTAIYAYTKGDTSKEKDIKTNVLIRQKNEFNTYKIYGLPKTAICNPGRESIMAVLEPVETNYLFFVKNTNGGHTFSANYKEHLGNIEILKSKTTK